MKSLAVPAAALLALAACKPPDETRLTAIIGAVLIDPDSPPISRSVLLVAGSRIRAVGEQASTPIPAGSDKINGAGKFLVPAPVEIPGLDSLPRVSTLGEAKGHVESGAGVLRGMIADTEEIDQPFLQKLRDLRVVFVPELSRMPGSGAETMRAAGNTRRLASLGVLIAAPAGADAAQEWQALSAAGLPPEQVLRAATTNAALAARLSTETGSLKPGLRASVWMLSANPLEDAANLSKVERALVNGAWSR